jgi:hypothetical protein
MGRSLVQHRHGKAMATSSGGRRVPARAASTRAVAKLREAQAGPPTEAAERMMAVHGGCSPTRSNNRRATRVFDPGNYDIYPPQVQEKTAETGDGAQHQAVHAE